jgi:hypothetical protein
MSQIIELAQDTFRNFRTVNVPSTGPHEPVKDEIKALFRLIDYFVSAIANSPVFAGAIPYELNATMQANTTSEHGQVAIVWGDPIDAFNGTFVWIAATGGGSWEAVPINTQVLDADIAEIQTALSNALFKISGHWDGQNITTTNFNAAEDGTGLVQLNQLGNILADYMTNVSGSWLGEGLATSGFIESTLPDGLTINAQLTAVSDTVAAFDARIEDVEKITRQNFPLILLYKEIVLSSDYNIIQGVDAINGPSDTAIQEDLGPRITALEALSRDNFPLIELYKEIELSSDLCTLSGFDLVQGRVDLTQANSGQAVLDWTITTYEGSNYNTDQSRSLPPTNVYLGASIWGQSLGLGAAEGDVITGGLRPPYNLAAVDPGWALMPSTGCINASAVFNTFTDLHAIDDLITTDTRAQGESPIYEFARRLLERMQDQFGEKRKLVCFGNALGGRNLFLLKRGQGPYDSIVKKVAAANAAARLAGGQYSHKFMLIAHGESDYSSSWFQMKIGYQQLCDNFEDEIAKATGQSDRVIFMFQAPMRGQDTGSPRLAGSTRAMIELCERDPTRFVMSHPVFPVKHGTDSHPNVNGYRQLGDNFGFTGWDAGFGTGPQPFRCVRAFMLDANTIRCEIRVPLAASLVIDTSGTFIGVGANNADPDWLLTPATGSEAAGKYAGFRVRDVAGTFGCVAASIGSTTDEGMKIIDVDLSRAAGAGSVISYASQPTGSNNGGDRSNSARGLVRMDAADDPMPDAEEIKYRWMEPFEFEVQT